MSRRDGEKRGRQLRGMGVLLLALWRWVIDVGEGGGGVLATRSKSFPLGCRCEEGRGRSFPLLVSADRLLLLLFRGEVGGFHRRMRACLSSPLGPQLHRGGGGQRRPHRRRRSHGHGRCRRRRGKANERKRRGGIDKGRFLQGRKKGQYTRCGAVVRFATPMMGIRPTTGERRHHASPLLLLLLLSSGHVVPMLESGGRQWGRHGDRGGGRPSPTSPLGWTFRRTRRWQRPALAIFPARAFWGP